MATFSLLVPTHREDRPLARCLSSVCDQLNPGDEVIVVGDTHDGPLPGVEYLVYSYGSQFKYLPHDAGHHCWGHCQLDAGLAIAKGDYYHCNDDDDIWSPDALDMMRIGVGTFPDKALLFRFRSQFGTVYWDTLGGLERNHIGGHCLVAPRVPGKVGKFTCEYNGDYDYVASAVEAFGGPREAIWLTDLVAFARP